VAFFRPHQLPIAVEGQREGLERRGCGAADFRPDSSGRALANRGRGAGGPLDGDEDRLGEDAVFAPGLEHDFSSSPGGKCHCNFDWPVVRLRDEAARAGAPPVEPGIQCGNPESAVVVRVIVIDDVTAGQLAPVARADLAEGRLAAARPGRPPVFAAVRAAVKGHIRACGNAGEPETFSGIPPERGAAGIPDDFPGLALPRETKNASQRPGLGDVDTFERSGPAQSCPPCVRPLDARHGRRQRPGGIGRVLVDVAGQGFRVFRRRFDQIQAPVFCRAQRINLGESSIPRVDYGAEILIAELDSLQPDFSCKDGSPECGRRGSAAGNRIFGQLPGHHGNRKQETPGNYLMGHFPSPRVGHGEASPGAAQPLERHGGNLSGAAVQPGGLLDADFPDLRHERRGKKKQSCEGPHGRQCSSFVRQGSELLS